MESALAGSLTCLINFKYLNLDTTVIIATTTTEGSGYRGGTFISYIRWC